MLSRRLYQMRMKTASTPLQSKLIKMRRAEQEKRAYALGVGLGAGTGAVIGGATGAASAREDESRGLRAAKGIIYGSTIGAGVGAGSQHLIKRNQHHIDDYLRKRTKSSAKRELQERAARGDKASKLLLWLSSK